jgi:predicted MPP superfamily phosphohydrolase
MIAAAAVLAFIILLSFLRVGVTAIYEEDGFTLDAYFGPVIIKILPSDKTKRKSRHVGLKILLFLILLVSLMLYDSNTRITVNEYPLYYENLPASFDGYRIAQLSDIHAAVFGQDNAKLIEAVRKAQADIIVITGDLIDDDNELGIVGPLIQKLTGIAPVYYITGNHEWDSGGLHDLLELLNDNGVTVLRNDYEKIRIGNDSIVLAGVDDRNGPADMTTPETFISNIRKSEGDPFIVLLVHRNSYLQRYAGLGIDLVLCGHAHGGLIRLPFTEGLIGPAREWFPDTTGGVYTQGGTKMLVSRGIGNHTGVPRFLNNPQVPVVILKKT